MKIAKTAAQVREELNPVRRTGRTLGLVPTMGALHEGHLSLIDAARADCDFVAVSIFVNPLQFGPNEDLAAYPRAPERDLAACEARGVGLVFLPPVEAMYAGECLTQVSVARLSETLCGASRPGHFAGVCTVVTKLLHIVQPDRAYFGAKDYQQAAIIRKMVFDLDFPLTVVVCPTVREADGLAMSSRNAYLTPEQRRQAPALYGALKMAEGLIRRERPPADAVQAAVRRYLARHAADGMIDYVQIVDPAELSDVQTTDSAVLIALAVKFGGARLIDNLLVDAPGGDD
ncbi:MAG TPA: pantoate--beta-alanine ligase [Phycisphaerae bacterium]|nr:pantoate--beta-alanine ligase [Phycisphaerae bacterium]